MPRDHRQQRGPKFRDRVTGANVGVGPLRGGVTMDSQVGVDGDAERIRLFHRLLDIAEHLVPPVVDALDAYTESHTGRRPDPRPSIGPRRVVESLPPAESDE